MKQQVNPALIAGAVVIVALLIFGIYKLTLGGGGNVSKDNTPDYARAAQRGQTVNMGQHYQQEQQKNGAGMGGRPGMGGPGR